MIITQELDTQYFELHHTTTFQAPITDYKNDLAPKGSLIFIFCPD